MKKILLIILIGICNMTFAQVRTKVSGKIIDDKQNCLFGVKIKNLISGTESISDKNGLYEIMAKEYDALLFQFVGLTTDKIGIKNSTQHLNLIMMNKDVNSLGANWSSKQFRKANRQIEKKLKKLYKKANKENVWKNSSCQHRI